MEKKVKIKNVYNLFKKYGDLNLKVNTPYGYKKIENCDITEINSDVINISTDNFYLNCSPNHLIKTKNGRFKNAILLNSSQEIKTINGNEKITSIELLKDKKDLYDIQVKDVEQYYSNGIVSHNSNFLESLCFTIFDKSPRALKSESAMNNKKNHFHAKFLYEIGDKEFRIKRDGSRKKTSDVVVKTDFSVKDPKGKRQSLNGERRSSTNVNIRNYLGDYDTFIMTALVPQIDLHRGINANLINMRQADRKNLLSRFLDFTIFQELYDLAREDMRSVEIKLTNFEKRDFSKELAHANIQIKLLEKKYKEKNEKKTEYDSLYKKINKEITALTSKLIKIDIGKTDIEGLEDDKQIYIKRIHELESKLDTYKNEINASDEELKNIQIQLDEIDDNIIEQFKLVKEIEKQREDAQHNIDKYQIKIDTKREQLGDFSKLVFNPECDDCNMNKKFVEDKMETDDDIRENETIVSTFKVQLNNYDDMLDKSKDVRQKHELYLSLKEQINKKQNEISEIKHSKVINERALDELNRQLEDTINNIKLYHKNKKTIEKNKEIQSKIDKWEENLRIVEDGIEKITTEIMNIYSDIELNKKNKQKIENEIEEVKNLEIQFSAYKYYMEAVEKDGVPFDLIAKTMPIIQREVNNILGQIVEFQINFEIDEQNKDIDPKIMYDGENVWAIELVSGMERFIAGIAIRVALLSVSSLPRPNFLIIDEGWSSLDADNANSLYRLFDYLRSQFDFIITISHLDWIKDMSDMLIELKNENGFSKIN